MKKIAFFVEGQTERIFIEKLIEEYYTYQDFNIKSIKQIGNKTCVMRAEHKKDNINYYFLIFDASSDNRVLSAIKERANSLFEKGYSKILGIRDFYPEKRENKERILLKSKEILNQLTYPEKILVIIAVMEIEAWFLADDKLFENIHPKLTTRYIEQQLNIDLTNPATERYDHPAGIINSILQLIDLKYKKREKQSYKIAYKLDYTKLLVDDSVRNGNRSFTLFLKHFEDIGMLNTDKSHES